MDLGAPPPALPVTLHTLPPELLDYILRLLAPSASWPDFDDEDRDRREVLRTCSLVSQYLRASAQPLLWRLVVVTDSEGEKGTLVRKAEMHGGLARTLRVRDSVDGSRAVATLRELPNVEELQFSGGKVDLDKLSALPKLPSLAVDNVELRLSSSFCFPALTELALVLVRLSQTDAATLLTPTALPNLRAYACAIGWDKDDEDFLPLPSPTLMEQLDCLQIDLNDFFTHPPRVDLSRTPVLHTIEIWPEQDAGNETRLIDDLQGIRPAHLRLAPWPTHRPYPSKDCVDTTLYMLDNLLALVVSSEKPKSLHLPIFLHTLSPSVYPRTREAVLKLLKASEDRDVEVVWHRDSWEARISVSHDFWRYAKELVRDGKARVDR